MKFRDARSWVGVRITLHWGELFVARAVRGVIEQAVVVETDQTKRNYLHPVAGSDAARIDAGQFLKRDT